MSVKEVLSLVPWIISLSSGRLLITVELAASNDSTCLPSSSREEVSVLKCSTVSFNAGSTSCPPRASFLLLSSSIPSPTRIVSTLSSRLPTPSPTLSPSFFFPRAGSSFSTLIVSRWPERFSFFSSPGSLLLVSSSSICSLLSTKISFSLLRDLISSISPGIVLAAVPSSSVSLTPFKSSFLSSKCLSSSGSSNFP